MKNLKSTFLLLFVFFLVSCDNDDNGSTNNPPDNNQDATAFANQYFGSEINRNFLGLVIDKNDLPIEGVTISIGNETATTDVNGVFIINDASVNKRFAYVKAEKPGYIHGSRSLVPSSGTNKLTIMLLEATVTASTASGTSETISLGNGASVALDGDYIKADGMSYSGSVDVIMHFLDPTDDAMESQMPGMLYAANNNNEERMLQTYGMLAVELRGSAGEDLNLAEGSEAEIKVPLDPSLVSNAPSTIPLWYFDEVNGYWKEEGFATLVGNEYVGTVSHFSFWNCDIPTEAINLCITAEDDNNIPVSNLFATITSTNYGTTNGYSNAFGEICGLVPSNETLDLNLFTTICDTLEVFSGSIGPFSDDSAITISALGLDDFISETVIGNFNNCSGQPIENGYVVLTYSNQESYQEVEDGNFEISLIRCNDNDTFSIEAYDFNNLQTSGEINYTFTTPLTNLGTLNSCSTVNEFIQYTIDDGNVEVIFLDDNSIEAGYGPQNSLVNFNVSAYEDTTNNCFLMQGTLPDPPTVGTYDNLDWDDQNDIGFSIVECLSIANENNNIIYNLTAFGEVGEYIDINFNGDYEDYQGNPHTINGIIHVLRDQ